MKMTPTEGILSKDDDSLCFCCLLQLYGRNKMDREMLLHRLRFCSAERAGHYRAVTNCRSRKCQVAGRMGSWERTGFGWPRVFGLDLSANFDVFRMMCFLVLKEDIWKYHIFKSLQQRKWVWDPTKDSCRRCNLQGRLPSIDSQGPMHSY